MSSSFTGYNTMTSSDEASRPPGYEPKKHDDLLPLENQTTIGLGADDVAIIPKGALDPVYEAKARILNRAVSCHKPPYSCPRRQWKA